METAACVIALARRESFHKDLPFMENLWEFCGLTMATAFDDATILSLFWHRANYHRPVDLPDTTGLSWRELSHCRPRLLQPCSHPGKLMLLSVAPPSPPPSVAQKYLPLLFAAPSSSPAAVDSSPEHAPVPAPRKHWLNSSKALTQAIDCGLWNVAPLLFYGCAKFLDIGRNWNTLLYTPIQSIPKMLNGWHVRWVCWPCKNWDVFSFQELWGRALSCCNMRWCSWINGTTMGLRISSRYLCAFKMPSIKCTCVRCP